MHREHHRHIDAGYYQMADGWVHYPEVEGSYPSPANQGQPCFIFCSFSLSERDEAKVCGAFVVKERVHMTSINHIPQRVDNRVG